MVHSPKSCRPVRKVESTPRRGAGSAKHTGQRAAQHAADGFLRSSFLPVVGTQHSELVKRKHVEKCFFDSLANLSALYGFVALDDSSSVYPHNILAAFRHAQQQIKRHCEDTELAIVKTDSELAVLATYKQFIVGQILYYIPLKPLFDLTQDSVRKPQADLMLSVYSYLFKTVKLPMYTQQHSYLHYQYEMIFDWYSTDEDLQPEDWQAFDDEFQHLSKAGKEMERELEKPIHLAMFQRRLSEFVCRSETDHKIRQVSENFFRLYTDYPDTSIYDFIVAGFDSPKEMERIGIDHYLSFIWDLDSGITSDLFASVNTELQELVVMDTPVSIQYFNKPQHRISMSLEFAERFFDLLDDLSDLLKLL